MEQEAPAIWRHLQTPLVNVNDRNDMKSELLKAVDLALAGNWDQAHETVQAYDSDAMAAWIHAVLHKIEGDESNSRYWYRRANKLEHFADESRSELQQIQKALSAQETD